MTDWSSIYNPFKGDEPYRPFVKSYCAFEILDAGTWYKIDMSMARPEYYPDVPAEVVERANRVKWDAVENTPAGCYRVDPAPYFEAGLREEFDDVRFLGTDFVAGGALF